MSAPAPVVEAIPASPLDDLGFTGLLCSVADYQAFTGDTSTPTDTLTTLLTQAQDDVAKACNRTLLFGHYKENCYVYRNGYAYPSAIPIATTLQPVDAFLQGAGVWVGFYLPLPAMPIWTGVVPPQTEVEYWGGFTDETIPSRLQQLIAKFAWRYANPVPLPGAPPGATNVAAGGVSATGNVSSLVVRDLEIKRDIEAFKRPMARTWQS